MQHARLTKFEDIANAVKLNDTEFEWAGVQWKIQGNTLTRLALNYLVCIENLNTSREDIFISACNLASKFPDSNTMFVIDGYRMILTGDETATFLAERLEMYAAISTYLPEEFMFRLHAHKLERTLIQSLVAFSSLNKDPESSNTVEIITKFKKREIGYCELIRSLPVSDSFRSEVRTKSLEKATKLILKDTPSYGTSDALRAGIAALSLTLSFHRSEHERILTEEHVKWLRDYFSHYKSRKDESAVLLLNEQHQRVSEAHILESNKTVISADIDV